MDSVLCWVSVNISAIGWIPLGEAGGRLTIRFSKDSATLLQREKLTNCLTGSEFGDISQECPANRDDLAWTST